MIGRGRGGGLGLGLVFTVREERGADRHGGVVLWD